MLDCFLLFPLFTGIWNGCKASGILLCLGKASHADHNLYRVSAVMSAVFAKVISLFGSRCLPGKKRKKEKGEGVVVVIFYWVNQIIYWKLWLKMPVFFNFI